MQSRVALERVLAEAQILVRVRCVERAETVDPSRGYAVGEVRLVVEDTPLLGQAPESIRLRFPRFAALPWSPYHALEAERSYVVALVADGAGGYRLAGGSSGVFELLRDGRGGEVVRSHGVILDADGPGPKSGPIPVERFERLALSVMGGR